MKIPVMIETVFLYSLKLLNKLLTVNYVSFSETICKHQSVHFIVHTFPAMYRNHHTILVRREFIGLEPSVKYNCRHDVMNSILKYMKSLTDKQWKQPRDISIIVIKLYHCHIYNRPGVAFHILKI